MARKSRKNTPIAVAKPTDNLTTKAVLSLDKEAKPYQVGIYARLSFEHRLHISESLLMGRMIW